MSPAFSLLLFLKIIMPLLPLSSMDTIAEDNLMNSRPTTTKSLTILEKKLKKLRNLDFSVSDNFYFAGRHPVKELNSDKNTEFYVVVLFPNKIGEKLHPNLDVNFFMEDHNLRCNYALWSSTLVHELMSAPKVGFSDERCRQRSPNDLSKPIFCHHDDITANSTVVKSSKMLWLPPNPMLYSPNRYAKLTNYREIAEALDEMSVHDVVRTCGAAYLFRGMTLSDPNKLFMRQGYLFPFSAWLLYLLEGKLVCSLGEQHLARGYSISLIQMNANYSDETNQSCGFYSRLSVYREQNNRLGSFLLAGILGSARLTMLEKLLPINKRVGNAWERCKDDYGQLLTMPEDGKYRLRIQISHYCSEDGEAKTVNFDLRVGPEYADDLEQGKVRAIYDYKDMGNDRKARATVDLVAKTLGLPATIEWPEGKMIQGFYGGGKIPGWRVPGGPVTANSLEKRENSNRETDKEEL